MSSICNAKLDSIDVLLEGENTLSIARKRWHKVYAAIFFCRAMHSLLKKSESTKISYSPVHTTSHFQLKNGFKIDSKCLTELMKEKNLHLLRELEGINGIASALQTDIELGIHDDVPTLPSDIKHLVQTRIRSHLRKAFSILCGKLLRILPLSSF